MVSFLSYNVGGAQQYDHVLAIARLLRTINTSIVCLQEAKWANDESFVNDFVKKSGYKTVVYVFRLAQTATQSFFLIFPY